MGKSKKLIILEKILRIIAVLILKKYKPRIISVTGSVGKTSTKEAVFTVLKKRFNVRKNEKNYNNEVGLPLTIIGVESGGNSLAKWAGVFLKAFGALIFSVKYPEVLVLEMGADRPGDIGYLTEFIRSEAAVITDISGSHLEFFKTINKVAEEKWTLVDTLPAGGFAVTNIDNLKIAKLVRQNKRDNIEFLTFGFSEEADVCAQDIFYNYATDEKGDNKEIKGLSFKLNYKGTTIPIRLNNILGRHNIYAALSGVAVGLSFKLNLVEIASSLENFSMPSGRMNLVRGIKGAFIIDDTYNSSPISAEAALEVMKNIEAPRKIAVMGDMLELGQESEAGHRATLEKFIKIKGDIFFAVGPRMREAAKEFEKKTWAKDGLFIFSDPMSAGKELQKIIEKGDLILIKGSQGMRMEKVVEEVMADPDMASKLLVRQDEMWKNKPWREV